MTNEELNTAIHRYMGNCICSDHKIYEASKGLCEEKLHWRCGRCGSGQYCEAQNWDIKEDYCNDYRAVREFLEAATRDVINLKRYNMELKSIMEEHHVRPEAEWEFLTVYTTPRQLAVAGARAIGLIKDGN